MSSFSGCLPPFQIALRLEKGPHHHIETWDVGPIVGFGNFFALPFLVRGEVAPLPLQHQQTHVVNLQNFIGELASNVLAQSSETSTTVVPPEIVHDDFIDYPNPPQESEDQPRLIDYGGLPPENGRQLEINQ